MKQYLQLLKDIKEKGTYKPAAREGMPGTQSYFGYQFRHNLAEGFPLLTTKKMFWKGVVVELLWFLRGDTNIKYLVDQGVNIWNEDAYNYYIKLCKQFNCPTCLSFDLFIELIKENIAARTTNEQDKNLFDSGYKLGDCGFQYGKVWRAGFHEGFTESEPDEKGMILHTVTYIDQIKNLIRSLKTNPESRRHLVTAIDPSHDQDLALYWCHAMFQFNCRPLTIDQRYKIFMGDFNYPHFEIPPHEWESENWGIKYQMTHFDKCGIPKYYLDCQLYQRSADVVLGVPFNIASYALLTEILAKICNMIPGEFIHTFGDVHIYDNHKEAVEEQLKREPTKLPYLNLGGLFEHCISLQSVTDFNDLKTFENLNIEEVINFIETLSFSDFQLENYNPQPAIKAELSTGLSK